MRCDVISRIFAYHSKWDFSRKKQDNNFYKRSYQPILRYLYTEAIKRQGEISLHKHFNCKWSMTLLNYKSISLLKYIKYNLHLNKFILDLYLWIV